jgi:hypothetical protein
MNFTSIIERIRRLRSQQPQAHPLDLSEKQVNALRSLRTNDDYAVFLKALDAYAKLQSDGLLRPSARNATVHYLRGHIAGLIKAGTLVDEVVKAYDDRATAERESERRKRGRSAGRGAALYGSSFWEPTR